MPRPPPLPRIEEPGQKKANSAQEMPRPFAPDKEVNGNASPQTTTAVSPGAAKTKEPDSDSAVVPTTDELIQEPSLLEVFAEELRIKYRLPEDDPTFALIGLFSEVERRELKRQQAFEHFADSMLREAKQVLESAGELSSSIALVFERLGGLDIGISEVQESVERFEECSENVSNETTLRLKAMAEIQSKLESAVIVGLEKNFWSRMLNRLMLALALFFGILIGSGLILFVLRGFGH